MDYSPDEIETQIQMDLPACKASREKYENDRVVIKQLLTNIEKNRVKWLREEQTEQEADRTRSSQNKKQTEQEAHPCRMQLDHQRL